MSIDRRHTPHFIYYNFGRIHKTLRVTPAMAAGVLDKPWETADVFARIEARQAEKPIIRDKLQKRSPQGVGG